tara:strand:+ start:379 stop:582 length:204 start_codon:yes stop_codon:yes gene_type:complete
MMDYDDFVSRDLEYYMDMVRLVDMKVKYGMKFTEEEKKISEFILQVQENNKINALRNKFEKMWESDE